MTVDNTSEKPLSYGLSDVLSTSARQYLFNPCQPAGLFVDNRWNPEDMHLFVCFYNFLFSAFCTNYRMPGVSFNSVIGCRATISSPCISIRYWSAVIAIASSADLDHRNAPLSSLLYMRRNPSPSYLNNRIRGLVFFHRKEREHWKSDPS